MTSTYAPVSTLTVPHSMVVPKAHRTPGESSSAEGASRPGHDPLYGLPLAEVFHQRLTAVLDSASAADRPVTTVLIRVGFDRGLSTSAERAVDEATRAMVANELRRVCRDGDLIARHDGADLAVVLDDTTAEAARSFVERATRIVRRAWLESEPSLFGKRPALSFGVATTSTTDITAFELELEAIEALLTHQSSHAADRWAA